MLNYHVHFSSNLFILCLYYCSGYNISFYLFHPLCVAAYVSSGRHFNNNYVTTLPANTFVGLFAFFLIAENRSGLPSFFQLKASSGKHSNYILQV